MNCASKRAMLLLLLGLSMSVRLLAQSEDSDSVPLGDLARSLRIKEAEKPTASGPVINNENLTEVMDEVSKSKSSGTLSYSFDSSGKTFQVSSPDVTCSLSFNSNMTAILSNPFAARDLPPSELVKLQGPAVVDGDALRVTVYNGTGWNLREITVGLTVLRHSGPKVAEFVAPRLLPANAMSLETTPSQAVPPDTNILEEKRSDVTVLYHLKGTAPPSATTVFQQPLDMPLAPGDDWHWAIVEAKGVPPVLPVPASPAPGPSLGAANVPLPGPQAAK